MKKIIFYIGILSLFGCTSKNESDATEWLNTHKKPIVCKLHGGNALGQDVYSFVDADGNYYSTGFVTTGFPDTIKAIK